MKINTLDFDAQALRDRILDLAMRGKLVPQDPTDESANSLVEKVSLDENNFVKGKKTRKSKSLPEITEDEKTFNIPDNWKWIRLGSMIDVSSGKQLARKKLNEKFEYPVFGANGLIGYFKKYNILSSKILIGRVGSVGEINIATPKTWVTDNALIVNIKVESTLSFKWLKYILIASKLGKLASRTSQPVISATKVKNKVIPLPPLEEQKRIANKISKLFGQIDKIESASQQYAELQSSLKAKVLDVAMHGKLVEQNSTDEPASVLLDKIKSEKDELIKEKKIKKSKQLPEITDEEKPFNIPDSWEWVRLGDILKPEVHKKPGKNFVYIDIASVDNSLNTVTAPTTVNVEKDKVASRARQVLSENDILFSVVRPYLRNIAMVPATRDYKVGSTGFYVLKPFKLINRKYIFYLVLSNYVVQNMTYKMKGDNSPSIRKGDLQNLVIPLPPLAEQARIVDKVEKVFEFL